MSQNETPITQLFKVGDKVVTKRVIDRFYAAVIEADQLGTVDYIDSHQIAVKFDEPIDGLEEWNNCVHWYSDFHSETDRPSMEPNSIDDVLSDDLARWGSMSRLSRAAVAIGTWLSR